MGNDWENEMCHACVFSIGATCRLNPPTNIEHCGPSVYPDVFEKCACSMFDKKKETRVS